MAKPMTGNSEDIRNKTGLDVGYVFLDKVSYAPQAEGQRMFDTGTGNFHLFPVLVEQEDIEKWKGYLDTEQKLITKIGENLKKKGYDVSDKSTGCINKKDDNGSMPKFYSDNALNHFFRYIQVMIEGRCYVALCKRFYIDKSNCVNCIYGEIQFYSSKNGQPNEAEADNSDKWVIHYPRSYKGQNEKMIRISDTKNKVNMYNPVGFQSFVNLSEDLDKYAARVSEAFESYIEEIGSIL